MDEVPASPAPPLEPRPDPPHPWTPSLRGRPGRHEEEVRSRGKHGFPCSYRAQSEPRYRAGSPAASAARIASSAGGRRPPRARRSEKLAVARGWTGSWDLDVVERAGARGRRRRSRVRRAGRPGFHPGRNRVRDRDRALEQAAPRQNPTSSTSSRRCSSTSVSPAFDAAAREEPVLLPRFLLAAEQHAVLPAHERRDTDARIHALSVPRRAEAALAPLRFGQLLDLDRLDLRARDRRAGRSASRARRRTTRASVFSSATELAAVAGVDEPRRVHDRDAVPRREPRARLHEPGVPVRDRDGEPGAARPDRPALARRARRRRGRGPRRPRMRASATASARNRGSASSIARSPAAGRRALGDEERREPRQSRRGSRATDSTPSDVSSRASIGAPARRAP